MGVSGGVWECGKPCLLYTSEGRKADCHRETGLDPKTVRKWWDCPPPAVRFENGHVTVRVSPSQELSDWLLDALHDGGQE